MNSRRIVSPSFGIGSSFCQNLNPLIGFLGLFELSLGAEDNDGEGIGREVGADGRLFPLLVSPELAFAGLLLLQLLRLSPPNLLDLADEGGASKYSDDELKVTCFGDMTGGVLAYGREVDAVETAPGDEGSLARGLKLLYFRGKAGGTEDDSSDALLSPLGLVTACRVGSIGREG
jgi:hypothetical protein